MIAIPDFISGAMENWGLITYRESRLLVSDSARSFAALRRIAHVIAHELSHQWFGNLGKGWRTLASGMENHSEDEYFKPLHDTCLLFLRYT